MRPSAFNCYFSTQKHKKENDSLADEYQIELKQSVNIRTRIHWKFVEQPIRLIRRNEKVRYTRYLRHRTYQSARNERNDC